MFVAFCCLIGTVFVCSADILLKIFQDFHEICNKIMTTIKILISFNGDTSLLKEGITASGYDPSQEMMVLIQHYLHCAAMEVTWQ